MGQVAEPLAGRLQLIAGLIKAGLPTPIYCAQLDGFDTHSEQRPAHAVRLRELDESLGAFLDDLDRSGLGDRVLVLAFSEFGRRLAENASEGTDHGTAGPVLLLGRGVRPGLAGAPTDLTRLVDGDPLPTTDFRRVYAAVLGDWLCIPPAPILGAGFEPIALIRS